MPLTVIRLNCLLLLTACLLVPAHAACAAGASDPLAACATRAERSGQDGVTILDKGEESLLARAWLVDHAQRSIDIQYFIWSTDNIGILAAEALLRAAERGVRVRVLVDDLMLDADDATLIGLNAHPNIAIRIYNPVHKTGVSRFRRLQVLATDFRRSNQRMHDKTLTVDRRAVITGGRNMADEYYDFDPTYNFRDRDVLLVGPTAAAVGEHFEQFWTSPLAVPVEVLLEPDNRLQAPQQVAVLYRDLHAYAADPANYAPAVRQVYAALESGFAQLLAKLVWARAEFLSDLPGKNDGAAGLAGGGRITRRLAALLADARNRVTIQSPYLILDAPTRRLFADLVRRGVTVRISTNSLSSTDNLQAFSGYVKQRAELIEDGIEIYEFKPRPGIQQELIDRYPELQAGDAQFALHAKTLVIDSRQVAIGTYNLDPRSANLNTEVGLLVEDAGLAAAVEQAIFRDMAPQNSWRAGQDNLGSEGSFGKRLQLRFWRLMPLEPIL